MSYALPDTDMSTIAVGQSIVIDLKNLAISSNPVQQDNAGTLRMHNESGVGLLVLNQKDITGAGDTFNLPSGGWLDNTLEAGTFAIKITAKYVLPSAPVNLLMNTYFYPDENIPPMSILGNSPIGVTGVVTLSNQTLVNMTDPVVPDSVITIGNSNNGVLFLVKNDGSVNISVARSGVVHTVFQASTNLGNNPGLSGQSGDTYEFLGNVKIDQQLTFSGGFGITFTTGSLSRISMLSAVAVINGKTSVNPGLVVKPDMVFITVNATAAPTLICGYDPSTLSPTNIDLWANGAGHVDVVTMKF